MTHLVVHDRGHQLSGVVRAGESWAAAARRTCASMHSEPVPLDLSGAVKEFQVDHDTRITLRAMTRQDLPDVARWRATEHVHEWWHHDGDPTLENVTAHYGADIDGTTPTRMWVLEANGRAVGLLQDYRIGDYPEYAALRRDGAGPAPDAIGVDYLIGDPEWVGRGYGVRLLWAWLVRARTRFPTATTFFAAPDERNAASLRILAKAGFVVGEPFEEPQDDGAVETVVACRLDVATVLG